MGSEPFSYRTEARAGGSRLCLSGRLTLGSAHRLEPVLRDGLADGIAELDLTEVTWLEGGVAALLLAASAGGGPDGRSVRIVGAGGEAARVLALYECADPQACLRQPPRRRGLLSQVGDATCELGRTVRGIFDFVGDLVVGVLGGLRRPRSVHFADLPQLMERAGADGTPIVLVINFLVGAILGLQGAIQLHRFAADTFLANLVGLSVVRELGPLMTAILVAGRSGAAYAAELGTMTVGEEVDALRTIGQDPQRFLVFPRVLALTLVVPILTAIGGIVGCLGGMFVSMFHLQLPPVTYLRQLQDAVDFSDVGTGLLKSAAFAAMIGLVACQRGLSTRGGAQGVGASTTSAVVVVLFGLVALDAVFTVIFTLLDW